MSSLEITDNQYCIRLSKEAFDLTLVRQLIKRIQAEETMFNRRDENCEEDLISRGDSASEENFDRLSDK